VILNLIFGSLALLSLALTLWQWLVARRFPLHQRMAEPASPPDPHRSRREEDLTAPPQPSTLNPQPPLTLLKPLKGCDPATEDCLRSWFAQQYTGPVQILFGVAAADDPVCGIVRRLLQEFPGSDAQLVMGIPLPGANAKVAKLAELESLAKHDLLVISDADVRVPPDFLVNIVTPLCEGDWECGGKRGATPLWLQRQIEKAMPKRRRRCALPAHSIRPPMVLDSGAQCGISKSGAQACGLVCCFYRLANPTTLAMQWEAIAINADFWSQVLQSQSLKPLDFALGAVMATRRQQLQEIGGFSGLVDCLADDYQLGNRIARRGHAIALSPVVVDCWSAPMGWADVWKHQLRWARTIRVCQPVPYFFSLLSNATLWPLLWLIIKPAAPVAACAIFWWLARIVTALDFQRRLGQYPGPGGRASPRAQSDRTPEAPSQAPWHYAWLIPVKDLLQAAIWLLAFLGNRIEWRGQQMRLRRDGTLERLNHSR
jgi:ceramide glucosyltransferase